MNDRPPSLPLPSPVHQHQLQNQGYSSTTASPRVGSFASSSSPTSDVHSQSSYTTLASSHGPKTPTSASHIAVPSAISSSLQTPLISGYEHYSHQHQHSQSSQPSHSHHAMNQGPADMYYQQPHMNGGQAPPPVSSGGMAQYNPHQQPTLLQPVPAQYPNPTQYNQYGYSNGLTSPPSAAPVGSQMGPSAHVLPLPGVSAQQSMQNNYSGFDNTGQVAPPGMKPRVTATLWEDEGSLCFQVEARGICVARREDNHMINGTKLLNVAGMTRGRRDGILKSEKIRHVVKIGPMHLKGVWIPFERALDFANKEKITELLFPLFVHNIAALLYHPTNQNRTNQVMAAAERRKQEQSQIRNGSTHGLPSLQHHSGMALPGPQQTLPSHANMTTPSRSSLDRAHTFPTPPTSASGVMGGNMSSSESFQWPQQNVNGTPANPMSIDTSLSNARSMPATPATTPPGPPMQTMPYQSSSQGYDNSRSMYHHQTPAPSAQHTPSQQTPHHSQTHQGQSYPGSAPSSSPQDRNNMYSHNAAAVAAAAASGYVKNEIPGTASSRTASIAAPSANEPVNVEHKASNGLLHSHNGHSNGVHDDEHEHETEYTHDSGAYDASRTQYNYGAQAPQVAALSSEHSHLSPDVAGGSGSHQAAAATSSGRSTPRSAAASHPYAYTQQGYSTPPRGAVTGSAVATATAAAAQASSNLYNVVTNDRGSTNGTAQDVYATGSTDMAGAIPNSYTTQSLNGTSPTSGVKRGRDDDDDDRSSLDQKRRRTLMDPVMPSSVYDTASTMNRVTATPVGARRHV